MSKKTPAELAVIMRRAHAITKKTLSSHSSADYRATFAAAMKEAWAHHRAIQAQARAVGGDEMLELIRQKKAERAARRAAGVSIWG